MITIRRNSRRPSRPLISDDGPVTTAASWNPGDDDKGPGWQRFRLYAGMPGAGGLVVELDRAAAASVARALVQHLAARRGGPDLSHGAAPLPDADLTPAARALLPDAWAAAAAALPSPMRGPRVTPAPAPFQISARDQEEA